MCSTGSPVLSGRGWAAGYRSTGCRDRSTAGTARNTRGSGQRTRGSDGSTRGLVSETGGIWSGTGGLNDTTRGFGRGTGGSGDSTRAFLSDTRGSAAGRMPHSGVAVRSRSTVWSLRAVLDGHQLDYDGHDEGKHTISEDPAVGGCRSQGQAVGSAAGCGTRSNGHPQPWARFGCRAGGRRLRAAIGRPAGPEGRRCCVLAAGRGLEAAAWRWRRRLRAPASGVRAV